MPPILLLDYDGTLARTDEAVARCMFDTLADATGAPPDPARVTEVVARGLLIRDAFASLLGRPRQDAESEALARAYLARYAEYDRRHARAYPGVAETLRDLSARGIPLLLVTNKETANADLSLGHVGLRGLIPAIVGAEAGQPSKPDPRLFHDRIAPRFPGAAPSDFIMVGDTETDLAFARAAGLRAAWARYGFGRAEACEALTPDFRLSAFADLARLPLEAGGGAPAGATPPAGG